MRKIILLFLILLSIKLSAQFDPGKIKIGVQAGYTFFEQKDLRSVIMTIKEQLPFTTEIIDDFKPFFYFGVYSQYELLNRFSIGPAYEYHYGGSRLGAKDYSATFSYDQYINSHQVGLKLDYALSSSIRAVFNFEITSGINISKWKTDMNLEVGDEGLFTEQQEMNYKGHSWNISPAVKFGYHVIPEICLFGALTYSFDLLKKYTSLEIENVTVVKNPDWRGLKLSVGLEF